MKIFCDCDEICDTNDSTRWFKNLLSWRAVTLPWPWRGLARLPASEHCGKSRIVYF